MAQVRAEFEEIDAAECWRLLEGEHVGRLAVVIDAHPDIFPVNYSLDASEAIIIRTALGTKLQAAVNRPVAFEIDQVEPDLAKGWSVVVHGTAHQSERVAEGPEPLDTWKEDVPYLLRIATVAISGRRIHRYDPDRASGQPRFES